MCDTGFIKLPRSLLTDPNWFSLKGTYQKLFLFILAKCSYRPTKHDNMGTIIELQPGEFCASVRQISEWCGSEFSKNVVERGLNKLISYGFLTKKSETQNETLSQTVLRHKTRQLKSVITICNPEIYGFVNNECETPKVKKSRHISSENAEQIKNNKNKEERNNICTAKISQIPEFNRAHNVFVSDEDHLSLLSKHKEDLILRSYDHLSKWKSQKSKSIQEKHTDIGRLESWVITKVREDLIKEEELAQREARVAKFSQNSESSPKYLEMAYSIEQSYKSPYYRLDIGTKGVEFVPVTGSALPTFVNFGPQFVNEINHTLQKLQFRNSKPKSQPTQIRTETMIEALKASGPIHSFV